VPPIDTPPQRAITWRSVTLGLMGVVLICGITPYNDYALNNTFLIGNNLPLGAVMLLFLFAVLVNGPLSKWAPRYALSSAELAVAFSMTLISCGLPSSGLMRYLPPGLVMPFYQAGANGEFAAELDKMHLARWLFPSFSGDGPRDWTSDPIVRGYAQRWSLRQPIPYAAWIVPILTWGIFLGALYGALMCIVTLVRRQWYENERLAFPLAQIELAVLERPQPGRLLNDMLGRRSFWLAFGAVFLLHCWRGMAQYDPKHFPDIPVYYDFWKLMGNPPWVFADNKLKDAAVFFTVVGVAYFLPQSIAFSLWFFYLAWNVYKMWLGVRTGSSETPGQYDQHFGSLVAFLMAVIWIGRGHWRLILAQAFRGARKGEPRGRYLSYPFAFWSLVGCYVVMVGWLMLAGCQWYAAALMVAMMLMFFVLITRFVAETGLIHGQLMVSLLEPWAMIVQAGWRAPITLTSFYLGALLQSSQYDMREPVPVYASHGLKLTDQTAFDRHGMTEDTPQERKAARRMIALLGLSLLVGYFVSFGSTLWTEYHYYWTQDVTQKTPINDWGAEKNIKIQVVDQTLTYDKRAYPHTHSTMGHWTFGFCFTALLAWLRLRFPWWPLHPIGYILLQSFPSQHLWLSFFIGWLAKWVILRLGGSRFYLAARPFFLGLIVGESAAAGFWLVVSFVLAARGVPYRSVNIMPG
jgi:hypothetical protein